MLSILNLFVDICLLRKAPQDVPTSTALLGLTWFVNLIAGVLVVGRADLSAFIIIAESLVDTLIMLGFLWGALSLRKLKSRFTQTATAAMGTSALLNLCALPLVAAVDMQESQQVAGIPGLILLALVIWSVMVFAHILRHSFELKFSQGMIIAFAYTLIAYAILGNLFRGV